jgi:ribosomal protein S6
MKTYELSYIVSPEMTSEEAEAIAKEIESEIQGKEGTVSKQSNPVAKTLSYPIKKHASGFFGFSEFQLEPEKVVELQEFLAKNKKIVRHMLTIKEAAELKKERRTRNKIVEPTIFNIEKKAEPVAVIEPEEEKPAKVKAEKEKVELKDIEQRLDELLSE